jgi:hypothetical protein
VRALRNTYASLLLIAVVVAYALSWLLPTYGHENKAGKLTLLYAGLGVVLASSKARKILSHVSTFIHEIAHCLAAAGVGASPKKITYNPDSSGLALLEFPEKVGRIRHSLVFLAGYSGPGVCAGALTTGIVTGRSPETLLFATGATALALVLLVRNLWGALVTSILTLIALVATLNLPPSSAEALLALLVGLFGTLGVRDAWDQLRLRESGDCDAACVARAIPLLSWKVVAAFQVLAAFVLAVGAIACLYISG